MITLVMLMDPRKWSEHGHTFCYCILEENVRSIKAYVTQLKERVAKLQYQKQLLVCQVLELEANDAERNGYDDGENACEPQNTPDTCRSDIHQGRAQETDMARAAPFRGGTAHNGEETMVSLSSSIKALRQEREFLSKWLNSWLTEEEHDRLYWRWRVLVDGKQRRLQLVNKLWTDTEDKGNIEESMDIVAHLVGFCEGGNVSKEMFELNFALPANKRPWLLGWQLIPNLHFEEIQKFIDAF